MSKIIRIFEQIYRSVVNFYFSILWVAQKQIKETRQYVTRDINR